MENELLKNAPFMDADKVIEKQDSDKKRGLEQKEVEERLKKYGQNKLTENKKTSSLQRFLVQFKDLMILLLLASAAISAILGNVHDAVAIFIAVSIVASLGFIQEYRAEKSIDALKSLAAPSARVIRDGSRIEIPAEELVPGDILVLETGNRVPADARLVEAFDIQVDESILTGESEPVTKQLEALQDRDMPISKKRNMIFMGTLVTYGRGRAVVVGTGDRAEIGNISSMIQKTEEKRTPLQLKLDELAKHISMTSIVVCSFVFAIGVIQGAKLLYMFTAAVSLAVAAIPEGLPIAVTITLAIGVTRMARRHSIIRKLPAVETLGSATVICSDKTGTLTQNEMTVRKVFADTLYEVSGVGYGHDGHFNQNGRRIQEPGEHLARLLEAGIMCNNSCLAENDEKGVYVVGQPTEGALLVAAKKAGIDIEGLKSGFERLSEIQFDSRRKRMTVIARDDRDGRDEKKRATAFTKGAADILLEHSKYVYENGEVVELTPAHRQKIGGVQHDMAKGALRVIALAYRRMPQDLEQEQVPEQEMRVARHVPGPEQAERVERDLVFLGLVGIMDPPREEVKETIKTAHETGVKVVMITGDSKETAAAIAGELNILGTGDVALSGTELDGLDDGAFENVVDRVKVYSRVSPEHKMRIVNTLKKRGNVVAMTGDGVNDVPALKNADIGIAMGRSGSDVAKEAADMVLTDDNFATIIGAIEEGKSIYNNIKNFLRFQLTTTVAAVLTITASTLLGWPLPLNPIQILWVNVIMDGPPAQSLSVEPTDKDVMKRPPRDPKETILSRWIINTVVMTAVLMTIGTLVLYRLALDSGVSEDRARTIAFTVFVMFQMFNSLNCRSKDKSFFKLGVFTNRYLVAAVVFATLTQAGILYIPIAANIFGTVPLSLNEWMIILGVSSSVFIFEELRLWLVNNVSDKRRTANH